jgi:quercetin dioxygenase-like cupin family protein
MPFFELDTLQEVPLVDGVLVKAVYGEKCSVSFLELQPFARIPDHHHENEQIGIVIEGELEYTIGDETKLCRPGTAFVVPPNTIHGGVVASKQPAKLLNFVTPARQVTEPLKYTI